MIKSLRLRNFQSHRDSRLDLAPGVNVIVGPSDSGKSALLRALSWVVWNRPLGDAFRSRWGGDTIATLELDDGEVSRGIDKKGGFYTVDGQAPLRAFRTDVPEPVTARLNLDPLNVQTQHDAPFLLSGSSGEAARQLNRAARLDVIDRSLAAAESARREAVRALTDSQAQEARLRTDLEGFQGLEELEELVTRAEAAEKGANSRLEAGGRVRALAGAATASRALLDRLAAPLRLAPRVAKVEGLFRILREAQGKVRRLQAELSVAHACRARLDAVKARLEAVPVVSLQEVGSRLAQAINKRRASRDIRALVIQARKAKDATNAAQSHARYLQDQFEELMPETCPLCGQEVS